MRTRKNKNGILSSWKDIANYLNTSVRTCMRWEKELDLPVYRMERFGKSSVFARKKELDQWLKRELNKKNKHKRNQARVYLRRVFFGVLVILMVFGIYFVLSKFVISPKEINIPTITPASKGPLTLREGDIITTEFHAAGSLRVWRKGKANSYKEVWRIEPVRHSSFAVGDVDEKEDFEIVAAGLCRRVRKKGERRESFYQYFVNIYKEGEEDWWKSSYFDYADCVFEEERYDLTEIKIGNIDKEAGNEIILITRSNLGIFKYDQEEGEVRLLRSRQSFFEDRSLFFKSLAVGNIDDDDTEEIIVSADEWKNNEIVDNGGYVLIFKYIDNYPELVKQIRVHGNCSFQSIRLGDVNPQGDLEIITPVYRKIDEAWNTFIVGWDSQGNQIFGKSIYTRGDYQYQIVNLDVGDLLPGLGEEIIVANQAPDELILYH